MLLVSLLLQAAWRQELHAASVRGDCGDPQGLTAQLHRVEVGLAAAFIRTAPAVTAWAFPGHQIRAAGRPCALFRSRLYLSLRAKGPPDGKGAPRRALGAPKSARVTFLYVSSG